MALGPMGWMAVILAVVILSLTFGPGWSLVFLIVVGVILREVHEGKQEEQEESEKHYLLDSARARDTLPADASDHAPVEVHKGKQEEQEKQNLTDSAPARGPPDHLIIIVRAHASDHASDDAPADASATASDHAPVEVHKGKQEEQEKQNLPDSAPARGALDHLTINVPADASDHASAHAPVEDHKGKQEEQEKQNLPDSASDHAPADASDHAPADVVDVPADGLALSVDAPTPVVDALASLADAPALSGDSLAPAVDDPADAALSVDALADAPAISADAQVDAPVDASALAPAVVAAGIRMRKKRPPVTTAVLKLNLHCARCIEKISKAASNTRGVQSIAFDKEKDLVMVTGTMDTKAVVERLMAKMKRSVEVVQQKKDKDGGGRGRAGGGGKKNKKDGGNGSKEEGDDGGAEEINGGPGEYFGGSIMEYNGIPPGFGYNAMPPGFSYNGIPPDYGYNYGLMYGNHLHPPQMFSDENPNACHIM